MIQNKRALPNIFLLYYKKPLLCQNAFKFLFSSVFVDYAVKANRPK